MSKVNVSIKLKVFDDQSDKFSSYFSETLSSEDYHIHATQDIAKTADGDVLDLGNVVTPGWCAFKNRASTGTIYVGVVKVSGDADRLIAALPAGGIAVFKLNNGTSGVIKAKYAGSLTTGLLEYLISSY